MPSPIAPLLTGLIFGLALYLSCVSQPSLLISQFSLTSSHVLITFLIASACSTLIVYASNSLAYVSLSPRSSSSYGWFGRYDANIVGGVLQGIGMAVTGVDPGTALVRLATVAKEERLRAAAVVLGGLAGGLAFLMLESRLRRPVNVQDAKVLERKTTIPSWLSIKEEIAVVGYEALLLAAVVSAGGFDAAAAANVGSRHRLLFSPLMGGLMIGAAQLSSVVLAKRTIGISSAYSELAGHIVSIFRGRGISGGSSNIIFAVSVILGSRLASQYFPIAIDTGPDVSITAALTGGFCTIFGARLAGGCTSGHGISGMSTLSISSFVTMASLIGGGITCRIVIDNL